MIRFFSSVQSDHFLFLATVSILISCNQSTNEITITVSWEVFPVMKVVLIKRSSLL